MSGDRRRISVIVVTYRRDACLVHTIACVRRDLGPGDELIVVDQVPDHTAEVLAALEDAAGDPRCRVLVLDVASTTLARNVGGLRAAGEVLLYLDDDVDFAPGLLDGHRACYDDPTVAGVAGRVRVGGRMEFDPVRPYVRSGIGCHMSFRRRAFLQVGGFDTNLIGNFWLEEYEFSERVRREVGRIAVGRSCLIDHLEEPSGGQGNRRRPTLETHVQWYYFAYHNLFYWALKRPMPQLVTELPRHLASRILGWTRPPRWVGLTREFYAHAVAAAARDAVRTARHACPAPYWPEPGLIVRELLPRGATPPRLKGLEA
ncbi:MAG TPA: glycosyltransferase [Polyangia bacterium]|jgi:GT2 family glycosyltransferase